MYNCIHEAQRAMLFQIIMRAGAGFAAAITLAPKHQGKDISSIQVFKDLRISLTEQTAEDWPTGLDLVKAGHLLKKVLATYRKQSHEWGGMISISPSLF